MSKNGVKKYEYAVSLTNHTLWEDWGKQLSEHGAKGWRVSNVVAPLPSILPGINTVVFIFERELAVDPDSPR